jgi:glutamate--cysteine ligase
MHDQDHYRVPHLTTALQGPLLALETTFLKNSVAIERWFRKQWQIYSPPITCSVDLRNAGFKLAAIDTNLFPAGFNNLNPSFMSLCIQAAQTTISRQNPGCDKIIILAESHTRNEKYFMSLYRLTSILSHAGYDIRVASLREDLTAPEVMSLADGHELTIYPLQRDQDFVYVENFRPCVLLLNNDLSNGIPDILVDIHQTIHPPVSLGWSIRTKSQHFRYYSEVVNEFSQLLDLDPWLLDPLFTTGGDIDFMAKEGLEKLAGNVETLLQKIQKKYDEYQITQEPFLIIKADSGTYGMAVMTIKSAEDVLSINRKQRTHMSTAKGHRSVNQVIIQEGVYTFETIGEENSVAEPVVYMLGHHVVGGFYRVHHNRGNDENLNSPGMHFEPLAFVEPCNNPDIIQAPDACQNRFYAYGVVARLALLAAAREIQGVSQ